MVKVSSTLGSSTSIFAKRLLSALSLSKKFLYSAYVVAPIHFRSPRANAGLRRLEASMLPPLVAPAPTMVWISSMNKMASSIALNSVMIPFRRFSKSPLYLVPETSAPISKANTLEFLIISGTSSSRIFSAKPSAMAVLPTPGSPTSSGLFFLRRHSVCITRSISSTRPTTGSIFPVFASDTSSTVNCSSRVSSFLLFFVSSLPTE